MSDREHLERQCPRCGREFDAHEATMAEHNDHGLCDDCDFDADEGMEERDYG